MKPIAGKWLQHPEKAWQAVALSRGAAEIGAIVAAAGIVPALNRLVPDSYDRFKRHFARAVVQPRADWLEKHVFQYPAFADTQRKLKETEDPKEKAVLMSSALIDFALSFGAGIGSQAWVQSRGDHLLGLPSLVKPGTEGFVARQFEQARHMLKPVLFDKVTNMAVVGLMQVGAPQMTTAATDLTASVLQKTIGLPPEATQYFINWQMPNLIGMGVSGVMLSRKYTDFLRQMGPAAPHL
jgi:hypothetical protein